MDAPGELREQLRPTIDWLAQQPDVRKLCLGLALADAFVLQLVVCNTSRLAAALQLYLAEAVALERGSDVVVERLSPYPLDWRVAGPGELDVNALGELVIGGLLAESGVPGRLVFVDAARAGEWDVEAWTGVLMRLNERRNSVAHRVRGPLTLLLSPSLDARFARLAPDLWSVRSLVVELREPDAPTPLLQAFEFASEVVEDEATLQHETERQRERAQTGSEPAMRSLRVLLVRLAGAKRRTGDIAEAERLVDEAMALAERLGDRGERAACQIARSDLARWRGDYDRALHLLDEAQAVLRELGDEWALADAVGRRADILQVRGELDEALRIRRAEQLPVYKRLGDVRSWAVTLGRVADILQVRGEFDEALRIRREEQLPVYERLGDVRSRAVALGKVADILRARGELDEALRIHRECQLPVFERLGDVRERAMTLGKVADILQARGELDEALRILWEEELPVYERLGDVRELLVGRAKLGIRLLHRGRADDSPEAMQLLTMALREARRLRLPEAGYIADFVRYLDLDPDAPPFV